MSNINIEELVGAEWAEWYAMTPTERFAQSAILWDTYVSLGGSLDPEPDTQSPFYDPDAIRESPSDGRPGLHIVRRSGV